MDTNGYRLANFTSIFLKLSLAMTLTLKKMKEVTRSFLPILLLPCLLIIPLGCSTDPSDIIGQWEEEGWKLVNFHGKKKPAERWSKLSSQKAKGVEATWVEKGIRRTKVYPQAREWILVLTFHYENGDKAAAVLRKRK